MNKNHDQPNPKAINMDETTISLYEVAAHWDKLRGITEPARSISDMGFKRIIALARLTCLETASRYAPHVT